MSPTIRDKLNPMLALLGILFIAIIFKLFSMLSEQEDRIDELCDRLSKIERDALKITFEKKDERKQK